MLSNSTAHNDATAGRAGTIVLLIDESSEMALPIAGGTKSKAESVATAVNSMLNQLTAGPDVRLTIVGYGGASDGAAAAQIRWSGPLSGRSLVTSSELAAAPTTVEQRIRRIPGVGGVGVAREETIQFPIWYVPAKSAGGGLEQAADFVAQTLAEAGSDSSGKLSLVIHICGRMPTAAELRSTPLQAVLNTSIVCHLHLAASDRIPATLYPSSSQRLASEEVVALFDVSSVLTDSLAKALRNAQVAVTPGARGLVHQGGMGDLIRFLMLAKAYASAGAESFSGGELGQPTTVAGPATVQIPPAPPGMEATPSASHALPTCDRVALIVLADRSQADPESGVWLRRQEQVNDMIGRIAKRAGGDVDVGVIVYGGGTVETGFSGSLQGKTLVADADLADGALRVEQVTEKVSNGIGGLVELKRSRPIFIDCEPGEPALNLEPAIAALTELIQTARDASEDDQVLPLVMHVTSGGLSPEAIAAAAARLGELGHVLIYHSVVPEVPQPTVAYPDAAGQISDPSTAAIWQITSPLVGAKKFAAKRPAIGENSRGLVVGAKFDLLPESIEAILDRES